MANRQIIFYKHYFNEFYVDLSEEARRKLNEVLKMVKIAKKIPI